jgi:hypothetical protein
VDLRLLTDAEKELIIRVSENLQHYGAISNQAISILDDFFRTKFTDGLIDLHSYYNRLNTIVAENTTISNRNIKTTRIKQLNLLDLFEQYADRPIVENCMVREDAPKEYNTTFCNSRIDPSRNCLIALVKKDNFEQYMDHTAKIYYTGKKFPLTVALNKLYYFMPYLKGKGIRDLYFIKIARIGTRKEGQPDEDKNDLRLVFEIVFVGQMFNDYKPVKLDIWRTYTDTTIDNVI